MSRIVTDLRSPGMRDRDAMFMRRFREVERVFLTVTSQAGFDEIRTPTLEPLHLFTSANALTPQALEEAYSFIDWDGWSGERVVMRPDVTISVARWYVENRDAEGSGRVAYVQPAFRFTDQGDRERWQCGVEGIGSDQSVSDVSMIRTAIEFLEHVGVEKISISLAHSKLLRTLLEAGEFSAGEITDFHESLIDGEAEQIISTSRLPAEIQNCLTLLVHPEATSVDFARNAHSMISSVVAEATSSMGELIAITSALEGLGIPFQLQPAAVRPYEYYSGITFNISGETRGVTDKSMSSWILGGRYDSLIESLGGRSVPAIGWAFDVDTFCQQVTESD